MRLLAKESVGNLKEDAGAVSGVALEANAASVLKVDEDGESVIEDLMAALSLDARQRADAAGIVFELRSIERLPPLRARDGRCG